MLGYENGFLKDQSNVRLSWNPMDNHTFVTRRQVEEMTPPRKRLDPPMDVDHVFAKDRFSEKINNHDYGYVELLRKQQKDVLPLMKSLHE
jgi:hypothetical protein